MSTYKIFFSFLIHSVFICSFISCNHSDEQWTHFRGSNLNGIARNGNYPVNWSPDLNIVWKTRIHDRGWSSPVVFDDQVWVSTATNDGHELFAVCLDFNTGRIIHDIRLFAPDSVDTKHDINSYATPTPCIEKNFVYFHFGKYGSACLKTSDGSMVWKRTDLKCQHIQGPGSSPILYKNLLILHIEGSDVQNIIALNKSTGETIWLTQRPHDVYDKLEPIGRKAYITPIIIHVQGKDILISNGSGACIAYDPDTGKEIWRIIRGEDSTISMPFFENGQLFFHSSFITEGKDNRFAELFAVDPSGTGNVTDSHVIWKIKTPILQLSTPVIRNGLIYTVDSKSMLICIDALSGRTVWSTKLKGIYNSSPVYASGKIYFSSTRGETLVYREGNKCEKLAENKLEGEIWATPAFLRDNILIRTSKYIYRIGK
jgi:outer membrane protein assembly factor BamB